MSFLKRETPHNPYGYAGLLLSYYTIPRNNRELQQSDSPMCFQCYNIIFP